MGRSQKGGAEELSRRIGIPSTTITYILKYFDESVSDKAREAADEGKILISARCTNQILKLGVGKGEWVVGPSCQHKNPLGSTVCENCKAII